MSRASERGEVTAPDYREARRYRQAEERKQRKMAVDMSEGVIVPAQGQAPASPGIMGRIEQHPLIALGMALIAAVAIGFVISKIRGTGSATQGSQSTNQPGTSQGLPTTDAQGNKVYYVPTSNTFLDYNNVQDSYNPSNSVATSTVTNTTNTSTVNNGQQENQPAPVDTAHYIGSKPLIPYGQYKGPSYSNLAPNTHYTYNGVNYRLNAGAGGRLWGTTPWGATYLLYGPSGYYGSQFQTQNVDIPAGYPGAFNASP